MDDFFKQVREARREALKNRIAANTILINEKLAKTQPFMFGSSLIPAMICGLEVKITNELPDNVSFAITEVAQTEREKLIAETRAETAKEILENLYKQANNIWQAIEMTTDDIKQFAHKYGVEVEE